MQLKEVIMLLNGGKSIADIADQVQKSENLIENKLRSAAIEFDSDEGIWKYKGEFPDKSLSRSIRKKIVILKEDKGFVSINDEKNDKDPMQLDNKELELIKEYINVNHSQLFNKKSFFLHEDIYVILKNTSKTRSLKINALLHILLSKGIEYYELNNDIN